MSERLTDEDIAALSRVPFNLRHDTFEANRWLKAMAIELQRHRARIAAHAAAHPERMSEESVGDVARFGNPDRQSAQSMALEIQQRRAADLTTDELDALRLATTRLTTSERIERLAESALAKIIAAHE